MNAFALGHSQSGTRTPFGTGQIGYASGGEPDRVNRIQSSIPMKRGGKAEEVAQAILLLLSDNASYTAGDIMGGV